MEPPTAASRGCSLFQMRIQSAHMEQIRALEASGEAAEPSLSAVVADALHLPGLVESELDLAVRVEEGLPAATVDALRELGFASEDVHRLVLNRTTLHRRRGARLARDESDRVVRLARVLARARRTFSGAPDYAQAWLREPKHRLGGRTPLDVLGSDAGARAVEELLVQIEEGIHA